jgi:exonuclease SbcD
MRLLHVSDWHLGRTTYNCPRVPDHQQVIGEILELAKYVRPHIICHTGDLFDRLRPAYTDLALGISALQDLASVAPVVVVCGNHDSPALFRLFATLLGEDPRVHFVDKARPTTEGGILEFPGEGEEVIRLAPLPFVHANRIVEYFEDPATWMAKYADRVHLLQDALGRGLTIGYDSSRHVLLFAAHLYVSGAVFSNSERPLHVSDAYSSRPERLPRVSYAAFGHIHRPQALPGSIVGRYAGSPIPLDFGEEGEDKVAVVVEAEPGRPPEVTTHALSGGRPLRRLTGTLEELEQRASSVGQALCLVTVLTEEPTPNVADRVRDLLPEAILLQVAEDCAARRVTVLQSSDSPVENEPSFGELFRLYLAEQGTKGAVAERVIRTFESLLQAVEDEEIANFPEVDFVEASEVGAREL